MVEGGAHGDLCESVSYFRESLGPGHPKSRFCGFGGEQGGLIVSTVEVGDCAPFCRIITPRWSDVLSPVILIVLNRVLPVVVSFLQTRVRATFPSWNCVRSRQDFWWIFFRHLTMTRLMSRVARVQYSLFDLFQ